MTFDDMLLNLLALTAPQGARPDVPQEAEAYFTQLVARFDDREKCRVHLAEVVPGMFRCLSGQPDWIQDPNWPWFKDEPLVFVGSLEAPPGTFHDDARFYVFWSPKVGITRCVIQVS